MASAAAADGATAAPPFKYTNSEIVRGLKAPKLCLVCWPDGEDEDEDEDEDDEDEHEEEEDDRQGEDKDKEIKHVEEVESDDGDEDWEDEDDVSAPREVNDKGFPITKDGMEKFMYLMKEIDCRDQDMYGMHIFNDWTGYGVTEVLENLLLRFNKILFKKDVSPVKKWAYVEGLVTFLTVGDLLPLMMCDNSEDIKEVFEMFIPMLIASYRMLGEHDLLRPDSIIPNVGIVTLLMLNFLEHTASDFDIDASHKIIRAADKAGIVLEPRKELDVTAEELEDLRETYREAEEDEEERARGFDWEVDFLGFSRRHPGGSHYNIEKMSIRQRAKHTYG